MSSSLLVSTWRVSIALLVGLASTFLLELALRALQHQLKESGASGDRLKRLVTLVHAGRSIGRVLIVLIVMLMILHELGINITPVLASAGVVGLAFSLGAQTVVRDFLGGVIILSENQFAIGDVISIGQITGTVERISLRATYLRDAEGKLNLIPNGDIRTISNLTAQWAQVMVTFNVDYDADTRRVLPALQEAIGEVQSDTELAAAILDPAPQTLGWTGFSDWAVQFQIIARTQPGKQWSVARALRKAAQAHLQEAGVRMAIPRTRTETASPASLGQDGAA